MVIVSRGRGDWSHLEWAEIQPCDWVWPSCLLLWGRGSFGGRRTRLRVSLQQKRPRGGL